ncbi:MAG: hypothetical protein DWQ04_09915 [Chloroflexi bacterium]|nr:MAG: hypothetical protein DWQ04_09915 [Chloroflexota bacterium]
MLKNGSFTNGWTDMPPAPGNLINQQPNSWQLTWIEPGNSLFGAGDKATGVPECVHKLARQLPAHEQLGAKNALILAGDATYKIFHFGGAFGAELKQTVTGLKPGSKATLTAPVLAVLYDETDPYGAESGVWVNGSGKWVNGGKMGNRKWYRHKVEFTVPATGQAMISIRVKSKWPRKKDFFIDGITLNAETVAHATSSPPTEAGTGSTTEATSEANKTDSQPVKKEKIVVTVPARMKVVKATSDEVDTVVIVVPKGTRIKVKKS